MNKFTQRELQFYNAIPDSWKPYLKDICSDPRIDELIKFLQEREKDGATIYPAKQNIFNALKETPFDQVKVVIVGQDPYHGPSQAHGLSFSVPNGVPIPPSLKNIFKELHSDLGIKTPTNGNLMPWAKQGVLLLNSILTVEKGLAASHANKGWELFTDTIIEQLIKSDKKIVFMLWGAYAQKKVQNLGLDLEKSKDLILTAAHPSPFSVTKFLGCKHFSKANAFLKANNKTEINWQL